MKKGQGFARRVTIENLAQFRPLLTTTELPQSSGSTASSTTNPPDPALAAARALFKGESARWPVPFKRPSKPATARSVGAKVSGPPMSAPPVDVTVNPPVVSASRGRLLWEKPGVAASDVGQQKGHPTGVVRLVKGGFKVGGRLIDQTTYFRRFVFGNLRWHVTRTTPRTEEADGEFDVTLLGKSYGVRTLGVSHMPSREANQQNYTTALHWRDLNAIVKKLPLVKKRFRIYAPAGADGPFHIEVL
jgi:hypothetical protein